jgi:hypothetical protein
MQGPGPRKTFLYSIVHLGWAAEKSEDAVVPAAGT